MSCTLKKSSKWHVHNVHPMHVDIENNAEQCRRAFCVNIRWKWCALAENKINISSWKYSCHTNSTQRIFLIYLIFYCSERRRSTVNAKQLDWLFRKACFCRRTSSQRASAFRRSHAGFLRKNQTDAVNVWRLEKQIWEGRVEWRNINY